MPFISSKTKKIRRTWSEAENSEGNQFPARYELNENEAQTCWVHVAGLEHH